MNMLTIPWTSPNNQPQAAVLVQISRLELARTRDVPGFLIAALRIRRIALRTPGAGGLSLRAQPLRRTFWTLSAWNDEAAIGEFMRSAAHRAVMVKYRDRMAGSHFHTWNAADQSTSKPSWVDARQRYETTLGHQ
ncbi:MAG: hypothetical protein ACI9N0_000341 [Ilumatobacter sp.]|jgi:hypothetical protein